MTLSMWRKICGSTVSPVCRAAFLCCGLLAFDAGLSQVQAEIFRYKDAKGRTLFTDHLLTGRQYRLVWRSSVGKQSAAKRRYRARIDTRNTYRNRGRFDPIIRRVAKKVKIAPELLHAVVQAESSYDPRARSVKGAMGLMQLMPATAKRYGVTNAWDPAQNLEGGARYLRDLLKIFDNDLRLAVAAYNAGEGAVQRNGNRIPPYPETRTYVRKVLRNFLAERKQRGSGKGASRS